MKRKRQRGFSAIEALAGMTFLSLTMVPLLGSMHKSMDAHREVTTRDRVEERARKVTQRLKHYLREAPASLLDALPDWPSTTQTIDYEKAESFDDQATQTENPVVTRDESFDYQDGDLWVTSGPSSYLLASGLTNVTFSKDGKRIVVVVRLDERQARSETITVKRKFYVHPKY